MFRSTAPFDKALDKATSQLLLEPDWDAILQICDLIRQNDMQPKEAILRMKKKVQAENPHVSMFALQTLESVVKNCGDTIHREVATKEFMEFMKDEAKKRPDPVKGKVLELVQVWSHAFRNDPTLKAVQDTYHLMKMEGYKFPTLKESDAMFVSEKAPDWKDGEVCYKCRVSFNTFNRKHHCRNCGQIFCGKCSSKSSILPKFGIEKEVRVCDTCHEQLSKPGAAKKTDEEGGSLPSEYLNSPLSKQPQVPAAKSEQELQEEEELQLAIALSKSEAENKERQRDQMRKAYGYSDNTGSGAASTGSYNQPVTVSAPVFDAGEMDPELARYLNRNYWEKRQEGSGQQSAGAPGVASGTGASAAQPSAPAPAAEPKVANTAKVQEQYQNGETNDEDQFLNALRSSIEIFVNRMKSDSMRGRNIANDSAVQTLFMTINAMHPELMKHMNQQEDLRAHYEALQDKLTQLKEAREALDALRDDHREKMRREAEERERLRQIQMQQKLEVMRQKKHEYLEYQRQLALQRMQEQDRLMNMRLAQQKQMVQMREMQYGQFGQYNQPYPQQVPQGYPGSGSTEGSPVHMMQQPQPGAYGQPPPQQHMGPGPGPGPSMAGQPPPHMGPPGGPGGPPPMGPQGSVGPQGGPPGQPIMGNQPYNAVSSQQMYSAQGQQGLQGYQAQAGMAPTQTVPAPYQQGPPPPPHPQGPPSGTYQPPPAVGQPQQPPQQQPQQAMYAGQPQPQPVGGGAGSGGHGAPPSSAPQGYGHPGGPEYNSYNMQSMANALPPNNQGQGQGQGYLPPMGQYPQQQYQQGAPPPQPQPPQLQQQPQQPTPREAELISFD